MSLIIDIETEPLPDDELRKRLPPLDLSQFEIGEFDPQSVKVGNIKDPAKIEEKIKKARQDHQDRAANAIGAREDAIASHWLAFKDKAALSATTGRVLAIAYYSIPKDTALVMGADDPNTTEALLIRSFWEKFTQMEQADRLIYGLNIFDFDLPFLVRRSWILRVKIPANVFTWWKHRMTWSERFVDIRIQWQLGQYGSKSSFDEIASAFSGKGKPEGISGKDFARLWREDKKTAIEYAKNDVVQPAAWLDAMGLECIKF